MWWKQLFAPQFCLHWSLWDVLTSYCGSALGQNRFSRKEFLPVHFFVNTLILFILNSLCIALDNLKMNTSRLWYLLGLLWFDVEKKRSRWMRGTGTSFMWSDTLSWCLNTTLAQSSPSPAVECSVGRHSLSSVSVLTALSSACVCACMRRHVLNSCFISAILLQGSPTLW